MSEANTHQVPMTKEYYCRRCGTCYLQEGSCEWCPDVELSQMVAQPARLVQDTGEEPPFDGISREDLGIPRP